MRKFTKRELKLMLVFGALLVVLLSVRFIITPSFEAITAANADIFSKKALERQMDIEKTAFADIESKLALEKEFYSSQDFFFKALSVSEADIMLQNMAAENGLSVMGFKIAQSEASDEGEEGGDIRKYVAALNLTGEYDDVMNFVDKIYSCDKAMFINGMEGGFSGNVFNGTFNIEIYYIDGNLF